jgi:hypothetical protein
VACFPFPSMSAQECDLTFRHPPTSIDGPSIPFFNAERNICHHRLTLTRAFWTPSRMAVGSTPDWLPSIHLFSNGDPQIQLPGHRSEFLSCPVPQMPPPVTINDETCHTMKTITSGLVQFQAKRHSCRRQAQT